MCCDGGLLRGGSLGSGQSQLGACIPGFGLCLPLPSCTTAPKFPSLPEAWLPISQAQEAVKELIPVQAFGQRLVYSKPSVSEPAKQLTLLKGAS